MSRSVIAKRRLRARQKIRKRLERKLQVTFIAVAAKVLCFTHAGIEKKKLDSEPNLSVYTISASEPSTVGKEPLLENKDTEEVTPVECCECKRLKRKLERSTGQVEYCNKLLEAEEARADAECKKRIKQVREFWIYKIYNQGSRPGKILKRAMQRCRE